MGVISTLLYLLSIFLGSGLEEVVEKASDSEGANTAHYWSDGGEIFSGIESGGEVAFYYSIFAGSASIYKSGVRGNEITRY